MKVTAYPALKRRQADGFAVIIVSVPALNIRREVDISFGWLREYCGRSDPLSLDLLLVASICYVVDKSVPRKQADDAWTRDLDVEVPVSDPALWNQVAEALGQTLGFLTGDRWNLKFVPLVVRHWVSPKPKLGKYTYEADAVCLFSGGLDSLVGAIDLFKSETDKKVLLLGHYDAGAAAQDHLFAHLRRQFPLRSRLLRIRVGHRPRAGEEDTLRSRSFIFLALGFYAARFYGPDVPVYACENGAIAMNVPLTQSRWGSCSTRTMHPHFLTSLQAVLKTLGFINPLVTPLEFKTKGECLAQCLDSQLLGKVAPLSVSCSHPTRKQDWVRKDANNCGYCFPCLFRRASLHKIGQDDGSHYGIDVCKGELKVRDDLDSASDLRAVVDLLYVSPSVEELQDEISLVAPVSDPAKRAAMVHRAFEEVRELFRAKAIPELKRFSKN